MASIKKQLIDSRLQRIANVLLLNGSFTDNLGLLNGKMGIAIFFFHYARYTGNKIYEDYAGELIDEIYEEINLSTPAGFANGLTGIGWGIEYLVQNGFVEADTDEALEEIDNRIYQNMFNSPILLESEDDIFGYGLYNLARLKNREEDDENITTLNIKATIIHLIDECERIIIHNRFLEYNIKCIAIKPLLSVLYFLSEINQIDVFPYKVLKCLRYIPPFIEHAIYEGADIYDKTVLIGILDRLIHHTNNEISETLTASREVVRASINNNEEVPLNNSLFAQKWYSMALPEELTGLTTYDPHFFKAFEVIDNEEDWNRKLNGLNKENLGLTGMAGAGWWLLNKLANSATIEEVKEKAL
jgi:hypothetical protein